MNQDNADRAPRLNTVAEPFVLHQDDAGWDRTLGTSNEVIVAHRSWPWWRWLLTGLSGLALALTAYLSWQTLTGAAAIGCVAGGGCDQVLGGKWSAVGGRLPVSGLAAGTYLAMLLASFFIGPSTEATVRRLAWGSMLLLAGAAAGSAVWFTIIQMRIVGAFCPYCMATHITGLLLAVLVICRAHMEPADQVTETTPNTAGANRAEARRNARPTGAQHVVGRSPVAGPVLAGLALAGILAVAQIVIPSPVARRSGDTREAIPSIDPHAAPLVGSPNALHVVSLLFDYQCSHCQQLHFMLDEVVRRYDGDLAFALCPTPLERQCNRYVLSDRNDFQDSCELARISLAVWVAQPDAFPEFDDWMFTFESGDRWQPRSLEAARSRAIDVVGREALDAALTDPWIDQYLQRCVRIYGETVRSGAGGVPRMVYGSRWVILQPEDVDDLMQTLHDILGEPSP